MLYRRAPRTKATIDRTSNRQSVIDSNSSSAAAVTSSDQQEYVNNREDNDQNQLDLTDSTLRQYNDVISASNGQDDSTVSFDDDDDSDEYAYLIFI